ncbi:MAG: TIGR02679 family protein, partial [Acidimicrobiales bacterium]
GWPERLRANGLLRRLAGGDVAEADPLLDHALAVLDRLAGSQVGEPDSRPLLLSELAAASTGDSHGLDPGRPVATLVLSAVAHLTGADGTPWRELWASVGVACDELSSTVLVLNLPADAASACGRVLRAHAEVGEPCRLTLRQLRRHPPSPAPDLLVFACENQAVVAAAADRLGASCPPLVCTEGQPSTAARLLLDLLARAGAVLAYHGDFDWGGIAIANGVLGRPGAGRPWRFTAADYRASGAEVPLGGIPVPACWDPDLAPAMASRGLAVHEEHRLDDLLADLADPADPAPFCAPART